MSGLLSIIGTRVEPTAPPQVNPPCPAAERGSGCIGWMRPIDSPQTVMMPSTGQSLERLRCTECRESGWYERFVAYAPMPDEVHF